MTSESLLLECSKLETEIEALRITSKLKCERLKQHSDKAKAKIKLLEKEEDLAILKSKIKLETIDELLEKLKKINEVQNDNS